MVEKNRHITFNRRKIIGTGLLAASTLLARTDRPTTPIPTQLYHKYDAAQTYEEQPQPTAEHPKIIFLAKKHHEHAKSERRHIRRGKRNEHEYPTIKNVRAYVRWRTVKAFGLSQWPPMDKLIYQESRWEPNVVNTYSGACGLFQAYPCSKMRSMKIADQVDFGITYISNRYGTPAKAWNNELIYGSY